MRRIGTQKALGAEERGRLIAELTYWSNRSQDFFGRRAREERSFLQVWRGQDVSGCRVDTDEEEAWPFDGSSDQRVRWGDTAFADYLALIMVALDSCQVEVTCDGSAEGTRRAEAILRLLKWCRCKLGARWYEQVQAMLRYMLVDTPAVAAMDVDWVVRRTMGVATLTFDAVQKEYATWRTNGDETISEADAAQEFALAVGGDDSEGGVETVGRFLTGTKGCRAEDVGAILAALAEDGECECLASVDTWEGPEITALRYGDDFMMPENTEDFDYANPLFRQQWVDETRLREMAAADDWDAAWVEETLKHKGGNFYDTRKYNDGEMKDCVNICWFYTAETNERGETTRFVSVLSLADGSAFGKRVLRSRRGRWETVFFRREVLANNCLASRGLAHICAPDQGLAKRMKDMANNNAIVSSLPAVKAKGARVRNVLLEPFGVVNMGQSDDVTFMQPPAYPAAAKEQIATLKDDMLAFLGLPHGDADVSSRTRSFVAWMMSQMAELYRRLVEVAQDNASDEALMGVTGVTDMTGIRHEELDGGFQLTLQFNPDNMNHEDLIRRVNALAQVIAPLDVKNEVDRGPVLRNAFLQLFPECANASFRPANELVADDVADEQQNFVKIKAGVMPSMDTSGKWNYAARLKFYEDLRQENPEAIEDMPATSQQILDRWLAALEQQNTQFGENAEIGKTGVPGVAAG